MPQIVISKSLIYRYNDSINGRTFENPKWIRDLDGMSLSIALASEPIDYFRATQTCIEKFTILLDIVYRMYQVFSAKPPYTSKHSLVMSTENGQYGAPDLVRFLET